jgi:Hint domain
MANTNSWIGLHSGTANFWDDATNWSRGVPNNNSDIAITASGTYTVIINAGDRPYQIKSLALGSSSGVARLTDNGSLSVATNAVVDDGIIDVGAGATASVLGNLVLDAGSSALAEGVLNVGGAISGDRSNVAVDGGEFFAGSVAGSNVYSLSLDGTLEIAAAVSSGTTFTFADSGADTLFLDDPGATLNARITGFGGGNIVDIGSLPFSSNYTLHVDGTTLTIDDGTSPVFTFADINNPGSFTLSDDGSGGTEFAACYVAGTHIETPGGATRIENLCEGDMVLTVDGAATTSRPVSWIGYRKIDILRHPKPETVLPVRILKDAFATGVPHRDLRVSPDHCIYADGVLIPARRLINGATIVQDRDLRSIEYFHVELETHALLIAEGLRAESYLDTGNRAFYDNAGLAIVLHPEFSVSAGLKTWQEDACAPLAVDDAVVEPVWQRLAARAEALGCQAVIPATSDDPQLHLLVGGRTIQAICTENGVHLFALPRGTDTIRVVSRSGSPTTRWPWRDDQRQLGVAIERIRFQAAGELSEVPMDHPVLIDGWHKAERMGIRLFRWTDGAATLTMPPDVIATGGILELHLSGTVPYPMEVTALAA